MSRLSKINERQLSWFGYLDTRADVRRRHRGKPTKTLNEEITQIIKTSLDFFVCLFNRPEVMHNLLQGMRINGNLPITKEITKKAEALPSKELN